MSGSGSASGRGGGAAGAAGTADAGAAAGAAAGTNAGQPPIVVGKTMQLQWNIPEFDGSHISSYLARYELLAEECHLDGAAKVRRFTFYCANKVI